jgi:oxygen-independent coproporphyrinogen-3 oxidase
MMAHTAIKAQNRQLSIYIHWPFCLSKCPYCGFASKPMAPAVARNPSIAKDVAEYLLLDLQRELEQLERSSVFDTVHIGSSPHESIQVGGNIPTIVHGRDQRETISNSRLCLGSIFFGGGTPSLMEPKFIENIINFLCKKYSLNSSLEISLEANPATFTGEDLLDFRRAGINRISLGVQSFFDANLQFLGRIYTAGQALLAAEMVAKIFTNFSFDFIYGYAEQTSGDLEKDLSIAIDFNCKHISCYQLTYEEGTVFFAKLLSGDLRAMDEKHEVRLYNFIKNYLQTKGMLRYEVSNYAKPSYECIHNINYWRYGDYLGIGPGAHSRLTIAGRKNEIAKTEDPKAWCKLLGKGDSARAYTRVLSAQEELAEMLLMGLRLTEGITLEAFDLRGLRQHIDNILKSEKVQFLVHRQLMKKHPTKLQLTANGLKKLDAIVEFLLENQEIVPNIV